MHRRQMLTSLPAAAVGLSCLGRTGVLVGQEAGYSAQASQIATGSQGVVATVHPLASQAAIQSFERGGNAIDAAIAASLMLSVVDGFNSGLGGGGLALVRTSDGQVRAYDGREMAPGKAKPEMFYRDGKPDPKLSQVGPLAAGVPGLLAVLERMKDEHGRVEWNESLTGAAQVAEEGFELDANYVSRLKSAAARLRNFQESSRILLDSGGEPWPVGHRLHQPDLSRTLNSIAEQGVSWFYKGEFAKQAAEFLQSQGGLMEEADFHTYHVVTRAPIVTDYRGQRVFGFPPPSSGGIHHAQMLRMLAQFDVAAEFELSEARGRHLLIEVMKRAMADRAYWLGDSDFAKVPRGLLDNDYLAARAATIDLERATKVESHGQPPQADVDFFGKGGHTTHLTTADREGNVVALTQTINTTFGCKMIVPGTGVVLNNELDDFSIAPGVRNAFGLLGSEANLIAPGKRPLSSMSPTIVVDRAGEPKLTGGAAGGPKIITAVLQLLVRHLDLGQDVAGALAAGRVHHQWSPDEVVCERFVAPEVRQQLSAMGHKLRVLSKTAVASGISFQDGEMTAASDPRVPSSARAV